MGSQSLKEYLNDNLADLRKQGLYNTINAVSGGNGPVINVAGCELINLSSNNYLGLAGHPRLISAEVAALQKYGVGAGAVRTINGTLDIHEELEMRLAEFKHVGAVITFQSGFACNMGAISAVMGKNDAILSDALNHASIIDGCRLSGAKIIRFEHSDMDDLRKQGCSRLLSGMYGNWDVSIRLHTKMGFRVHRRMSQCKILNIFPIPPKEES